jgi:hypothetical protein
MPTLELIRVFSDLRLDQTPESQSMQDGLNDYSQVSTCLMLSNISMLLPCYQMSKTKNQSKQEQILET